jgi:hypothetical protein
MWKPGSIARRCTDGAALAATPWPRDGDTNVRENKFGNEDVRCGGIPQRASTGAGPPCFYTRLAGAGSLSPGEGDRVFLAEKCSGGIGSIG